MAEPHASFGAVVIIGQPVVQELLRLYHHDGSIPHRLANRTAIELPNGAREDLDLDLYLDVPRLAWKKSNAGRFELAVDGWGSAQVGRRPRLQVRLRAVILIAATPSIAKGEVAIRLEPRTATLETLEVTRLDGRPLPSFERLGLALPSTRERVQEVLRERLADVRDVMPPIGVQLLGDAVEGPDTRVVHRTLDGALALGIDIREWRLSTFGKPDEIRDFRSSHDIGIWLHPWLFMLRLDTLERQFREAVKTQGARVDDFEMGLREGALRISGKASMHGEVTIGIGDHTESQVPVELGSVTATIDVVPKLERHERVAVWGAWDDRPRIVHRRVEELWFDKEIQLDVQRPWFAWVLQVVGVFLFGLPTVLIESAIQVARSRIVAAIKQNGINHRFTMPKLKTRKHYVHLRLERFSFFESGVFVALELKPEFAAPFLRIEGNTSVEELRTRPLVCRVGLPVGALPDDPLLRIRWTLRRMDRNQIVLNEDGPAKDRQRLELDLAGPGDLLSCPRFQLSCRVYHVLGGTPREIFNDTRTISTHDRLRSDRPFVRWRHKVRVPWVAVGADGSREFLADRVVVRQSRIHRTDPVTRCWMAARYSPRVAPDDSVPGDHPHLEYLDRLPFSPDQLRDRRSEVCDYCFFGGPTRSEPLPLP